MKIFVKVTPKAKTDKIIKISDTNFKIWVRELPEKGKANRSVIRLLADYFNIGKSNIKIVTGSTSKLKIVELNK